MKQGVRRAIAHSLADSLASGCSLLLGVYDFSVRAHLRDGRLVIDCLAPKVIEGKTGPALDQILAAMPTGLATLCASQRIDPASFSELTVIFMADHLGLSAITQVAVHGGPVCIDTYVGTPLKRRRIYDGLGRIRTIR